VSLRVLLLLALGALTVGGLLIPPPAVAAPAKPELWTDVSTWTRDMGATFQFTSDGGASFVCRLDGSGAQYASCTSPASYAGISEGLHSFHVRAVEGSELSPPSNFSWTVDLTPPVLPGNSIAEATSPAGATVTFAASDNLDPAPRLRCVPDAGSTFALGTTAVTCTAVDAAGNESPSGTFAVVVRDTTPPVLAPHADVLRVKESPQGVAVDYALPLAQDAADPSPAVRCEPGPGTLFPVGSTAVTCRATDAAGHTSDAVVFNVVVQEGAMPAKPGITADVPRLTRSHTARFQLAVDPATTAECRLDGPFGEGSFMPCGSATLQTYSGLADGAYLFTLQVTNGIGNVSQSNYAWTVDTTGPATVASFSARGGDRRVRLAWRKPTDLDYSRVRIWRKRVGVAGWRLVAERSTAVSFTDRNVANQARYRYLIRSVDRAGNRSPAVEASARPSAVFSPQYDALLRSPPLVDWRSVRNASYYNMQLWRNGRKILSVWPLVSRYRLRSAWTFHGRRYSLASGRVTVYVWPGFGAKAAVRYGPLLGSTSFRVV
jgi:hypothetical protein